MPTNLLLLPVLAGYWFLHALHYTRFRSQTLDGYRLLLESALAGSFLTLIGWFLVRHISILLPEAYRIWERVAPSEVHYLGTACATLMLGLASPYLFNFCLDRLGFMSLEQAQARAILRYGNAMQRIFHEAYARELMVLVTLDNRKAYAGYVAHTPNLTSQDAFVAIVPCLSGHRCSDTLKLQLTVDYLHVYEKEGLDPYEFVVVLPIPQIRTASFFDAESHEKFLPDRAATG